MLAFSSLIFRRRWTLQIKNRHQLRKVPSALLINSLEIGVAQKTPAAPKANFPLGLRRWLVFFL